VSAIAMCGVAFVVTVAELHIKPLQPADAAR
jgi:hypothetical protein